MHILQLMVTIGDACYWQDVARYKDVDDARDAATDFYIAHTDRHYRVVSNHFTPQP